MKGPLLAGTAPATAEQGHRDAGLLQRAHGQPSAHIEALQHLPLLVARQAAIGEHVIHIADHQADPAQFWVEEPA